MRSVKFEAETTNQHFYKKHPVQERVKNFSPSKGGSPMRRRNESEMPQYEHYNPEDLQSTYKAAFSPVKDLWEASKQQRIYETPRHQLTQK